MKASNKAAAYSRVFIRAYRGLRRLSRRVPWPTTPTLRKPVVAVVGGSIVAVGLAMLVLPGPALIVIPVGLAVLTTEFVCLRRWLRAARRRLNRTS